MKNLTIPLNDRIAKTSSTKDKLLGYSLRVLGLCLFMAICLVLNAQTYINPAFDFHQIDYTFEGSALLNSQMGEVSVDVNLLREYSEQTSGFINVVTPLGWVVQNVPIPEDYSYATLGIPFHLSLESGVNVQYLLASISFDHQPILERPNGSSAYFTVGNEEVNGMGYGEGENGSGFQPVLPSETVYDPNLPTFSYHQEGHKNVEAADMQCGPMAVANSLQWLEDTYPEYVNIPHEHVPGLKGDNSLVGKLDVAMGREVHSRRRGEGITAEQGLKGKLKYLAENNITNIKTQHMGSSPIDPNFGNQSLSHSHGSTTVNSTPLGDKIDVDKLIEAVRKGKDVEFAYYWRNSDGTLGGHFVEVVGAGKILGVPYITFMSDTKQSSDTEGTSTDGEPNIEYGIFGKDSDGNLILTTHTGDVIPASFYTQCAEPPTNNNAPTIHPSSFQVPENSPSGTPVGQVRATDPNRAHLTYEISGGNNHNTFSINPLTGQIYVNDPAYLDYEARTSILIQVKVSNTNHLYTKADILILIIDQDESTACHRNLALHRPTYVSSFEHIYPGAYAVDGDETTRWSSHFSDLQWIYVDLGKKYTLCKIVLKWERAFARDFKLQFWSGNSWLDITEVQHNQQLHNVFDNIPPYRAQFVRLLCTRRATQWGHSLYEFEIYGSDGHQYNRPPVGYDDHFYLDENSPTGTFVGQVQATDPDGDALNYSITNGNLNHAFAIDPHTGQITVNDPAHLDYETYTYFQLTVSITDGHHTIQVIIIIYLNDIQEYHCDRNLALHQPVQAYTAHTYYPAVNAVDGNGHSRWASHNNNWDYIYVDLGAYYDLCKVALKWGSNYAQDYQIQIWNGIYWETIRYVNGNTHLNNVLDNLNGVARFVAVVCTRGIAQWSGYSLYEFEVYGRPTHNRLAQQTAPSAISPPTESDSTWESQNQPAFSVETALNVYPNPAKDQVNLSFTAEKESKAIIHILDIQGRSLMKEQKTTQRGENTWQLNIGKLAAGTYLLRIEQDGGSLTKRFVKVE